MLELYVFKDRKIFVQWVYNNVKFYVKIDNSF